MKNSGQKILKFYRENRSTFLLMVALFLFSSILFIMSIVTLSPSSPMVKVGYSDIGSYQGGEFSDIMTAGGYRDGGWGTMLEFTIFALVLGVMHNAIAVKLYNRRGEGVARAFLIMSMMLVFGGIVVLLRLLGEG